MQLTQGSLPFIGSGSDLVEDNINIYYDSTSHRIGINLGTTPTYTGDFGGYLHSIGVYSQQLAAPSAPTVAAVGTTGSSTYAYAITGLNELGETTGSSVTQITNGNATLSVSNFNTVSGTVTTQYQKVRIYRTNSNGSPATIGLLTTISLGASYSYSFNDTGSAPTGSGIVVALTVNAGGSGGSNGTFTDGAFTGGGGSGATFSYTIFGGALTTMTLTNVGSGYTSVPTPSLPSAGALSGQSISVTVDPTPQLNSTPNTGLGVSPSSVSKLNITWTNTSPITVGGSTMAALNVSHAVQPTLPSSGLYAAFIASCSTSGSANYTAGIFGYVGGATHGSSGTMASMVGLQGQCIQNTGAGTVTLGRCFYANQGNINQTMTTAVCFDSFVTYGTNGGGTTHAHYRVNGNAFGASSALTNEYGFSVAVNLGSSKVTSVAALALAAQSGATNNSTAVIGTNTIPTGQHNLLVVCPATGTPTLELKAIGSQTADHTDWGDSSSNILSFMTAGGALALRQGTTTAATAYAKVGGSIFDHFGDQGNTTTGETTLYTDTTAANVLTNNGDKLTAVYSGVTVAHATATRQLRVYFGGTVIFDSTAQATTSAANWVIRVSIIRDSSTSVRCGVTLTAVNGSAWAPAAYTAVTGLTLSGTNILKITGQSSNATNDIVAKVGAVQWRPAA